MSCSIMDMNIRLRTLFKCLLISYILTLFALIHKMNDEQSDTEIRRAESQLRNLSQVVRNVTKYVYLNRTETEYVYRDRIVYTARKKHGPGEMGKAVSFDKNMLPEKALEVIESNKKQHGFNIFVSDIVNLRRQLKDARPEACKQKKYPDSMPPVSIVIIFRDEWHSILLRTVYSVFEHSPENFIKEIILVDDGSENPDLKAKVDVHVASVEKLKLVRNPEALGLMMARQKGIEATTADYFIVMDGHMEVNEGWLEPLIFRLLQKPNALLCSHVGVIHQDTMEYSLEEPENEDPFFDRAFPYFDLTLDQMWTHYSPEFRAARNRSVAPLEYGTIQGMMTVMRKEFFMQLGGFDPGMRVWGSEQIELSVKVWLCGGQVEMIPCSKVAHMYRVTPWGGHNKSNDFHSINKYRMSEVWMSGAQHDLLRDFLNAQTFKPGNISDRIQIRERNQCKPYKYFLDKVRSMSNVYIPEKVKARGPIYNSLLNNCLDCAKINGSNKLIHYQCTDGGNQYFILTEKSHIRTWQGNLINIYSDNSTTRIDMLEMKDDWDSGSAVFDYQADNTLRSVFVNKCLTVVGPDVVELQPCMGQTNQQWDWRRDSA